MAGILFIHGTGTRQTAASVNRERMAFVQGVQDGLLSIAKLGIDEVGRLTSHDTGLGIDVRFGEYHTLGPVAKGKPLSRGVKQASTVRSLRWTCNCCLQRSTPITRKVVPTAGAKAQESIIRKYYPQLDRFLEDSAYRDAVIAQLDESWPDDPAVVIAHSMGTVVALSALARLPQAKQPTLFVTLGSPLPFQTVYRRLETTELGWAQRHRSLWLNVYSKNDIATNRHSLPQDRFPEVINLRVRNRTKKAHGAAEYLQHQAVAHVLWAVTHGEPARDSRGRQVPWSELRASELTNNQWNPFAQVKGSDTSPKPR